MYSTHRFDWMGILVIQRGCQDVLHVVCLVQNRTHKRREMSSFSTRSRGSTYVCNSVYGTQTAARATLHVRLQEAEYTAQQTSRGAYDQFPSLNNAQACFLLNRLPPNLQTLSQVTQIPSGVYLKWQMHATMPVSWNALPQLTKRSENNPIVHTGSHKDTEQLSVTIFEPVI